MSGMNDQSTASSKFDVAVKKQRGLLSREERHVLALEKAKDQAQYTLGKAQEAVTQAAERLRAAEAEVANATKAFDAAKADLEAK